MSIGPPDKSPLVELIKNAPVLGDFKTATLESLCRKLEENWYDAGTVLIEQGKPSGMVMLLVEGELAVSYAHPFQLSAESSKIVHLFNRNWGQKPDAVVAKISPLSLVGCIVQVPFEFKLTVSIRSRVYRLKSSLWMDSLLPSEVTPTVAYFSAEHNRLASCMKKNTFVQNVKQSAPVDLPVLSLTRSISSFRYNLQGLESSRQTERSRFNLASLSKRHAINGIALTCTTSKNAVSTLKPPKRQKVRPDHIINVIEKLKQATGNPQVAYRGRRTILKPTPL